MKANLGMLRLFLAVALLADLFASPFAFAQEEKAARQVTLSLDEFEELFSSAKLKESERRLEDDRRRLKQEHDRKMEQVEKERLQKQQKEEKEKIEKKRQSKLGNNKDLFVQNFEVLNFSAIGSYNASSVDTVDNEENMAVFEVEMMVRIMAEQYQWTTVPLVANTTVASHFQIELWQDQAFVAVDPILRDDIMLLRRRQASPELVTSLSDGLFRVTYQVYSRVAVQATSRNNNIHSLAWSQFLYPLSHFCLRVHNSVLRDLNVQPVEAIWHVEEAALRKNETKTSSDLHVTLPLTADKIEIRWLDKTSGDDDLSSQKYEMTSGTATSFGSAEKNITKGAKLDEMSPEDIGPQVTVLHDVMHSVGEGTVRSAHILEFISLSSSSELSSTPAIFSLNGNKVRITSMEGHALQSWDIVKSTKDEQVVRIVWKRSHLDSTATLVIHTESDRASGAPEEQVVLPRIECRDVLRQAGHVGVTKDANVEVHEHKTDGGMSRCEANEISSQLRLNVDRPIVLSYKYLNPANASVVLDVKEHIAMETLEATVDRLHYKAVVTETHSLHSLLLVLQSTKLQYLQLHGLPESASMYTLQVNSVPAKPVGGDEKTSILVPLLVGLDPEAANAGRSLLTSVELNYISAHGKNMGRNGTFSLAPPQVKLPISVLTAHLRLPKGYDYEFSGDFGKPGRELAFPAPSIYSYQTGKRVVEKDYQFSFKDDVWPDDEPSSQEASVKIVTPNTGRSFFFHRLLVVDTQLTLNATFSEEVIQPSRTSWWAGLFG